MFDPTFALKLSFQSMKLLFCTKILNTFIQIQPKITIEKRQAWKKIVPKISYFSQILHHRGNSGCYYKYFAILSHYNVKIRI